MRLRIIVMVVAVLVGAGFLVNWYYQSIQKDYWREQDRAVQTAFDETDLVKAEKIDSFVGEQPYTIVFGEDEHNKQMIVWVGKEDVHSEYAADGISEKQLKRAILDEDPRVQVIRLTPGKLNDEYVWEAFYKKEEDNSTRYYYGYFKFTDGSLLDTYSLSKTN